MIYFEKTECSEWEVGLSFLVCVPRDQVCRVCFVWAQCHFFESGCVAMQSSRGSNWLKCHICKWIKLMGACAWASPLWNHDTDAVKPQTHTHEPNQQSSSSAWCKDTLLCLPVTFVCGQIWVCFCGHSMSMCFALTPSRLFFLFSPHSPAVRSQGDRGGVWCPNAEESHAERPGGSCELSSLHCTSNCWFHVSYWLNILRQSIM